MISLAHHSNRRRRYFSLYLQVKKAASGRLGIGHLCRPRKCLSKREMTSRGRWPESESHLALCSLFAAGPLHTAAQVAHCRTPGAAIHLDYSVSVAPGSAVWWPGQLAGFVRKGSSRCLHKATKSRVGVPVALRVAHLALSRMSL